MPTNFPAKLDTTSAFDTLGANIANSSSNVPLAVAAIEAQVGAQDAAQVVLGAATSYALHVGFNNLLLGHAITFTFPTAAPGIEVVVLTTQGAGANYAVTWPAELNAGDAVEAAVTASNSAVDINKFICDGTSWYLVFQGLAQA